MRLINLIFFLFFSLTLSKRQCKRVKNRYVDLISNSKLSPYLSEKLGRVSDTQLIPVVVQLPPPNLIIKTKVKTNRTTVESLTCYENSVAHLVESMVAHHEKSCTLFQKILNKLINDKNHLQFDRVVKGYYITNTVFVNLNKKEVLKLVEEGMVKQLSYNLKFQAKKATLAINQNTNAKPKGIGEENWGKKYIGMNPNLQTELSTNLTPLVLGSADSGVDVSHLSIQSNYRGKNSNSHSYHHFDGTLNLSSPITMDDPSLIVKSRCLNKTLLPCDDLGHGTHTTSIAVGKLGIAPTSQFITCKNMVLGYGSVESYLNCLQFFLAPTNLQGTNPNTKLRPHVINNSYGCPLEEGCDSDAFDLAIKALTQSGIAMVVSAGNEGLQGCGSLSIQPGTSNLVFTVGATKFKSDGRAPFSSTGPKPKFDVKDKSVDLLAPGTQILGAKIDLDDGDTDKFIPYDGTSMAAPHVSAVYLAIIAACPQLYRKVEKVYQVMRLAAKPNLDLQSCGTKLSKVNHESGKGRLDLKKALILCKADTFFHNEDFSSLWKWIQTFH